MRNPLFDILKALLMIWVVFGHLGHYGIVDATGVPVWLSNAKIGVNMPLFFMLSGYFAATTFEKGPFARLLARTLCLVWPQFFAAGLFAVIGLIVFHLSLRDTIHEVFCFWFLKTMAVIYFVSALVWLSFKDGRFRWAALTAFYLALWLIPDTCLPGRVRFWIGPAVHMFPFFWFGLMVLSHHRWFEVARVAMPCGIIFVLIIFLQGDSMVNGMNFWTAPSNLFQICATFSAVTAFLGRLIVGISGSVFALWLCNWLIDAFPIVKKFAPFGTTTLGVYVIHEWILLQVGNSPGFAPLPSWSWVFLAVVYFLVCHYLIVCIRRVSVLRCLMFGNEEWLTSIIRRMCAKND